MLEVRDGRALLALPPDRHDELVEQAREADAVLLTPSDLYVRGLDAAVVELRYPVRLARGERVKLVWDDPDAEFHCGQLGTVTLSHVDELGAHLELDGCAWQHVAQAEARWGAPRLEPDPRVEARLRVRGRVRASESAVLWDGRHATKTLFVASVRDGVATVIVDPELAELYETWSRRTPLFRTPGVLIAPEGPPP